MKQWSINKEIFIPILLIFISVILYKAQVPYTRMAAFFPLILIILLLVLSVVYLIEIFYKKKYLDKIVVTKKQLSENKKKIYNITLILILLFLYIANISILGFVVSSLVFLIITPYLLGFRNIYILIIFSITFVLVVFLLFKIILTVPLPEGLLGLV